MNGLICFLAWRLFSTSPTLRFKEIQVYTGIHKEKGTSLWNVFVTAYRSSNVLSTWLEKGGRLQRDKLDRRLSTELITPTSELRRSTTVLYRRDRQALSTARFCRAGQLAMASTWYILTLHLRGSHSGRWIMTSTRHAMSRHHCGLFVCLLYLDRRRSLTHPPLHAVVGRFIRLYCSLGWDDSSICCAGVWYGPPAELMYVTTNILF